MQGKALQPCSPLPSPLVHESQPAQASQQAAPGLLGTTALALQ